MQGKCERGRGSANADGAGAKVFAGDGCSQGRLSAPWPRFHGVDRADVYIIIRVCASYCGESALNPPTSPPISRRRPSPAPHSDTPFPSTSARPRSPDARPQAARCIPRRPHNPFSTEALRSPPHSDTPSPSTSAPPRSADTCQQAARCTPAGCAMHAPPTSQPFPRRRPSLAHAQRHALPVHSRSSPQPRRSPAGCAMHSPQPSQPFPRRRPSLAPAAPTHARSARCIPRRPHNPFPAEDLRSPTQPRRMPAGCAMHARRPHNPFPAQRHAASPSVPLRAQKNGTAQCMCDAECLGRPSLRSVIWVGEPRAVRRRCGALACRHGA